MTPKEKAKELVESFQSISTTIYGCSDEFGKNPCIVTNSMLTKSAKKCALICVYEKKKSLESWKNTFMGRKQLQELKEVKKEIENL